MPTRKPISSESVKKATGKTLEEWYAIINKEGGAKMSHKEIARMLYDKKYIKSGWWCQSVTVQYEYAFNKRKIGETKDAGWEIGVQRTFKANPKDVWKLITCTKGQAIWLAPTLPLASFRAGTRFKTKDGKEGEVRTYDEGKKIRLKLDKTTVQVYVLPAGQYYLNKDSKIDNSVKTTAIHFHQEKLSSRKEREKMRRHWQNILKKLHKACNQKNELL